MREILLDTHIILWSLFETEKLNKKIVDILKDAHNEIFYSIASMWEVSIKHNLNKLPLSGTEFMHYCKQAGFKKLKIDDRHIVALETLEVKKGQQAHKDSFDKVLISQAKADAMNFITHDEKFAAYDEPNVWIV